jgi:hypothetical protein
MTKETGVFEQQEAPVKPRVGVDVSVYRTAAATLLGEEFGKQQTRTKRKVSDEWAPIKVSEQSDGCQWKVKVRVNPVG